MLWAKAHEGSNPSSGTVVMSQVIKDTCLRTSWTIAGRRSGW
jgi:hypothetical protein